MNPMKRFVYMQKTVFFTAVFFGILFIVAFVPSLMFSLKAERIPGIITDVREVTDSTTVYPTIVYVVNEKEYSFEPFGGVSGTKYTVGQEVTVAVNMDHLGSEKAARLASANMWIFPIIMAVFFVPIAIFAVLLTYKRKKREAFINKMRKEGMSLDGSIARIEEVRIASRGNVRVSLVVYKIHARVQVNGVESVFVSDKIQVNPVLHGYQEGSSVRVYFDPKTNRSYVDVSKIPGGEYTYA